MIPPCSRKEKKPRKVLLNIATWNVITLLDCGETERPEYRMTLVGWELSKYNIDIAALSETCFAGEGQLTEMGAGYSFFSIGRAEN